MTWHAVYKTSNGVLVSVTSVVPIPMPRGHASVELGDRKPDWSILAWDPATLAMTPKPPRPLPVDRVDDLIGRVPTADARLTAATRTALRTEVAKLLGSYRYRDPSEAVEL